MAVRKARMEKADSLLRHYDRHRRAGSVAEQDRRPGKHLRPAFRSKTALAVDRFLLLASFLSPLLGSRAAPSAHLDSRPPALPRLDLHGGVDRSAAVAAS